MTVPFDWIILIKHNSQARWYYDKCDKFSLVRDTKAFGRYQVTWSHFSRSWNLYVVCLSTSLVVPFYYPSFGYMIVLLKKYKRAIISLGVSIFLLLNGVISMASDIEFTGTLFVLLAVSSIGYLLLFWLFNRKKQRSSSRLWTKNEIRVTTTLTGLLYFIGIFESYPAHPGFTSVFILLFIYILIFGAVLIRNYYLQKKGAPTISKSVIKKLIFWSFVIGVGRVLIMLEQYENNDAMIIMH